MVMTIVKRELRRVFTDRRLVFTAFILPALSIFLLYSFMGRMVDREIEDIYEHTSRVHVYQAPETFISFWERKGNDYEAEVTFKEGDYRSDEEALRQGDLDLVLVFEESFDQEVLAYESSEAGAHLNTYYNPSEEESKVARRRLVDEVLEAYEEALLTERFGTAAYARAFEVDAHNPDNEVYDPSKAAGEGFAMVFPLLVGILLFAGAMGVGMDTIAGEKERGTMTALLLAPVSRTTIALGKVLGLAIIALISASMSFIAIIASFPSSGDLMTGGAATGGLDLTAVMAVELLLILLSLVAIYVGLICVMSVRAKSVKEAGSYVSPIYMVVMFSAFSTMFQQGEPPLYRFAIPVMGNILAVKQLLSFELSFTEFSVTFLSSVVAAGLLIYLITRAFEDERVMMNN